MKILKLLMALIAFCCAGVIVYLEYTERYLDENTIRVYCGLPENLISNLCCIAAPLLLGTVALLTLIEKVKNCEKGRVLMLTGTLACFGFLGLMIALSGGRIGYLLHELKSPDGNHAIYYMNDTKNDKTRWFRKGDSNEYEYFWFSENGSEDRVEWQENEISIDGHKVIYEWLDK